MGWDGFVSHSKVGSGSTFAYGVLDTGYKYDLTVEEAFLAQILIAILGPSGPT